MLDWYGHWPGDEEARARGTQKSVLERKAPPTFPLVIEMRERAHWVTHWVEDSVDCLLHGKVPVVQARSLLPVQHGVGGLIRHRMPCKSKVASLYQIVRPCRLPACRLPHCWDHMQVRRRDTESREVMIEERRYDKAGQECGPTAGNSSLRDSGSTIMDSLDLGSAADEPASPSGLPLQSLGGGFGSSFADDEASDNPYAWAQRLREIPDKVCVSLQCLAIVLSGTERFASEEQPIPCLWCAACIQLNVVRLQDALQELALLGYTSGDSLGAAVRRKDPFAFANGTGTGRRNNRRRPDRGNAHARR